MEPKKIQDLKTEDLRPAGSMTGCQPRLWPDPACFGFCGWVGLVFLYTALLWMGPTTILHNSKFGMLHSSDQKKKKKECCTAHHMRFSFSFLLLTAKKEWNKQPWENINLKKKGNPSHLLGLDVDFDLQLVGHVFRRHRCCTIIDFTEGLLLASLIPAPLYLWAHFYGSKNKLNSH